MLRDAIEKKPDLTAVQAKDLLTECLRVLYYRDARAFHKVQISCNMGQVYKNFNIRINIIYNGFCVFSIKLLQSLKME